jgi:hypothetical protein
MPRGVDVHAALEDDVPAPLWLIGIMVAGPQPLAALPHSGWVSRYSLMSGLLLRSWCRQ